jgi:hypothetical protein
MLNAFVDTFLRDVNIEKRKEFVTSILTDSDINGRYKECGNLHKSIIQHNDNISLHYISLTNQIIQN